MKLKKKNVVTAGLAVSLAAAMLIGGGTFAYLSGTTKEVVNEFKTEQVTVDLEETDNDYEIIPGTTQNKDPKVTVDSTIDAYVFVEVTDETDGLVTYEIESGWTELDGYDDVYYREYTVGDDTTYSVLEGDQVSYDAALENSDMLNDDGTLKNDVTLSFKAYAIQKEPFKNVNSAYDALKGSTPVTVSDSLTMLAAIEDGKEVLLTSDVKVDAEDLENVLSDVEVADIDLNGYTLSVDDYVALYDGQSLNLSNGDLDFSDVLTDPDYDDVAVAAVGEESTLVLDNVNANLGTGSILVNYGIDDATISVTNSKIESSGYFGISTNAYNPETGEGVSITVDNSEVTASAVGVMLNVPGTISIIDSYVSGQTGALIRCGTARISGSTIEATLPNDDDVGVHYFKDGTDAGQEKGKDWGSGNSAAFAALTLGNYQPNAAEGKSYPYPVNATIEDSTFVTNGSEVPQIVIAACREYNAKVNITSEDVQDFNVVVDDVSTVTVNGTSYDEIGVYNTSGAVG